MRLIDVHAHIQQHDPAELDGIVERADAAGVGAIVVAGVTVDDSARCVEIARSHESLFAGTGVHPTDLTGPLSDEDTTRLDGLAGDDSVVVMSEVGIDHQAHVLARPEVDGADWRDVQEDAFRAQIAIARRQELPVVFHVREPNDDPEADSAWPTALRILRETATGDPAGAAPRRCRRCRRAPRRAAHRPRARSCPSARQGTGGHGGSRAIVTDAVRVTSPMNAPTNGTDVFEA